jgi:hypothetical protein
VEKAFWDETTSFLQYKATSLALKRGKTAVNWIFQSPTRQPLPLPNYVPMGETDTAAYCIHKALAKI